MTGRLIRITTALAVMAVAGVAAIISYQHAYELVRSHGESGTTARGSVAVFPSIPVHGQWCWLISPVLQEPGPGR